MPGKNIIGTGFDDNIVLTDSQVGYYKNGVLVRDKSLQSTQGNDTISTGLGNDIAKGDMGNDLISGGAGNDKLYGGSGNDVLSGDDGNDILYGNTENDTLNGGAGDDRLLGGEDNDLLNGDDGNDTLDGGSGADTLNGGEGNDVLRGGSEEDGDTGADSDSLQNVLNGGAGNDKIFGSTGNDILNGGTGNDSIQGGKGGDLINGDGGNDTLQGSTGNDTIYGGDGDDKIYGGASEDAALETDDESGDITVAEEPEILSGGAGNDKIYGATGADQLLGGLGNDSLFGGRGNDRLQGDSGADYLRGGSGNDMYIITAVSDSSATATGAWDATKGDSVYGFVRGADKIDLTAFSNLHWSGTTASAGGVWQTVTLTDTFLYADTNSDGVADLAIRITGHPTLTASDVLLGVNNNPIAIDDAGNATESGVVAGSNAVGNVLTGAGADISPNGDALNVTAIRTGTENGAGNAGTVGTSLTGQYGSLLLNADGTYTYQVDNANAAVNALNGSESLTDSFTYTLTNAHGVTDQATLVVTVHGANDAAVIDSGAGADAIVLEVNENATTVTTIHATDVDHGDVLTYSITGGADKDAFSIDAATGVVTFKTAPDAESGHGDYELTVQVSDGHGGIDTQTLTVHVNDVNEFGVSAPVDSDISINAVDENAAVGTIVGVIALASDADATNNGVTYSLVDNAGGKFAIDVTTGVITVAGAIDRETDASLNLTVRATSADGSTADAVFTVGVNDVNESPVAAPIDTNAAANVVDENAAIGTAVGITALASDADATNNSVTYSLTNNADGKLAIDANTGVITVAGVIDREDTANLNIIVRATSADGSTADTAFTVGVNDVNESAVSAPVDTNGNADIVDENAAVGTVVGITAHAADADATNNGVTYSLADDAGGKLAIDAATGIITIAGVIDSEASANLNIIVRATSADGSTSDTAFTIGVNDANEYAVTAPVDTNANANAVDENAAVGTVVGITALASDADTTNNGVTYSLTDDAGGKFAIDATTGVVTVAGVIDREVTESLNIVVRATSADGSVASTGFTIGVNDLNEYAVSLPIDNDATDNTVAENAAVGTVVGITALASDADVTTHDVSYSLLDNAGGKFAIDALTGVVTVAGVIDREAASSLNIIVRATSADGSTADATFSIGVLEVNEFSVSAPLDNNAAANIVDENAAVGTVVGITALASDGDATNNGITYSLIDNAGGKFAIDALTGVVTVAGLIDRETDASLNIIVRATSADGSQADTGFALGVNDVNEYAVTAPIDANSSDNVLLDNVAAGTAVGIIAQAADADATTNGVSYSLVDDAAGKFTIDAATGMVTTTGAPLTAGNLSVVVRALSADGSFADTSFGILINPLNANAPVFISGTVGGEIENSSVNHVVYNANATDADGDILTYSLTGTDSAFFSINASTGVVRFLASPDYENPLDANHDNLYDIVVHANDGVHDTTRAVVISVTDEVETPPNLAAPVITSGNVASETENTAASIVVYDANATDADGDALTYSLSGNDSALFSINAATGEVRFLTAPDYEAPLDLGADNLYNLIVHASDGVHDTALAVDITITNVFESTDADSNDFDNLGSDLLQNTTPSAANDTIVGGNNIENVNAGDGADLIYGRDGNDMFNGSLGDDTIYGQRGDDNLAGGNQNDLIYGGSGADSISGGSGNDIIYGGSGEDTINGGAGNDTMIGGYGADTLVDGSGTDRFVYLSIFDGGDNITGVSSTSRFDLTAIDANESIEGDNTFVFVAAQTTDTVANSITWNQDGLNTHLRADVNGDSVADFELTLVGTINLTETMFLL